MSSRSNVKANPSTAANGVRSSCDTVAANSSFTAVSKHIQGNTYFGLDDATTAVFFAAVAGKEGAILVPADIPGSTPANDFAAPAVVQTVAWAVK